ncbi:MAG: tripartite tricarboxylate transporter substrate-binding protein [Microvirga sp.]|jgi:tripartite-type tricarboxylate transporter receptor subunit TctC
MRLLFTLFALWAPLQAVASPDYPTRPITMIVPAAAGGTTDVLARIAGKIMSADLGQPIIIENVGGAGGSIGVLRVVRAEPNGYTLSFANMGQIAANATLYPKLNYDPRRDLAPIGLFATVPMVLSTSKASGLADMSSFLRKLREKDNIVNFANSGPGSTGHLAAVTFLSVTNTKATLVAYRGAGPAMNDMLAGVVDAIIDQTVTMIPMHTGGSLTAIAVSSKGRLSQIPDVPTFEEAGVPEFDLTVWNAVAAPRGTPPAIIDRLEKALRMAVDDPEVRQRFVDLAAEAPTPDAQGAEALRKVIAADVDRLAQIIKAAGITGE